MTIPALVLVLLAFLAFSAGAIGLQARVSWDPLGKALLALAIVAQWGPWGH